MWRASNTCYASLRAAADWYFFNGYAEQIVGRERRGRVSQLIRCGRGCFDSRRRVNSTVRQLSLVMKDTPRFLLLAGLNGIVSFVVLALNERVTNHYVELQREIDMLRGPVGYMLQLSPFWNVATLVLHVVLFLLAAVLLRRFFFNNHHTLVFWLAVASVVCVAWLIVALTGAAIGTGNSGDSFAERILEALIYRASQQTALNFAIAVFGVNVVFGAVVQLAANRSSRGQPHYS